MTAYHELLDLDVVRRLEPAPWGDWYHFDGSFVEVETEHTALWVDKPSLAILSRPPRSGLRVSDGDRRSAREQMRVDG